ncbi:MAG TPA: O-antigen ligase family protein [Thermoanaerobaculia bacterium]|nr:O-antigen ligase family protein [Thermoanaerobaculia bacterium]
MSRRREPRDQPAPDAPDHETLSFTAARNRWQRVLSALLLAGAAIVPIFISPGADDLFRLPKQLVLYAVTIVAATLFLTGWLLGKLPLDDDARRRLRTPAIIAAAGVAWAILTTLTSTNRAVSVDALVWGTALTALLVVSIYALRGVRIEFVAAAVFIPALINAIVLTLQSFHIWNPWVFDEKTTAREMRNALLGNPDDLGVYLAVPALFALVLAARAPRFRALYAAVAATLFAGLLMTQTVTAIGAYTIAATIIAIFWHRRLGIAAAVAVPLVIVIAILTFRPTHERFSQVLAAAGAGQWNNVVSGRVVPFAVAWQMFADHPIAGVGPGAYKYHYMDYRLELGERHPRITGMALTNPMNFAEAHNDHLQLLAEMGVPGYAAVIAAIVLVGAITFRRRRAANAEDRIARLFALPFAVAVFIMMIAQFPLQLGAPAYTYAFLAAACLAWRELDVA